jgi:hypothetical protein
MTGAPPSTSGIIGNDWFDREENRRVTSVDDPKEQVVGAERGRGASPRRLLSTTIGDELKLAGMGGKTIGVSLKDRSAILPAGHMADAAYWFDPGSGNFVSSTFYLKNKALPEWAEAFNKKRMGDQYANKEWVTQLEGMNHSWAKMPAPGPELYNALERAPFGNDLVADFAIEALTKEKLGKGPGIDVLTVSFSANDYLGHALGPEAPEIREMSIATDVTMGRLFAAIDKQAGLQNTLIVLTADHGVGSAPKYAEQRKLPGGMLPRDGVRKAVEMALTAKFGASEKPWVQEASEVGVWLDAGVLAGKKIEPKDAEETAARALSTLPHVMRVYTRTKLTTGSPADRIDSRVFTGYFPRRSPDLIVVPDPGYTPFLTIAATHGTPFVYDAKVPMAFLSPMIKAGKYGKSAATIDIAPTIAALLGIIPPSGSMGRVLDEMLR